MKETFQNAAVAFGLQILGAILSFLFSLLTARFLGPDGVGLYLESLNLALFAVLFARVGLDNAILRFNSANFERTDFPASAGLYRQSTLIIGGLSILFTIILIVLAPWLAETVFEKPDLVLPIQLMGLSVAPLTMVMMHTQLLKSLNKIRLGVFLTNVCPTLVAVVLLIILGSGAGVSGAIIAYGSGITLSLMVGVWIWRRATPQLRNMKGYFDARKLFEASIPMFSIALMSEVILRSDILILSASVDSDAVGIYGSAKRTALLIALLLSAVNSVIGPRFVSLFIRNDMEGLDRLVRKTSQALALLALPILLVFVFFSTTILGFFGEEFIAGAPVMIIIAVGQYVNVSTGAVSLLLLMTGHEKQLRNIHVVCVALNIPLYFILIPNFGVVGAAIAYSVSVAMVNVLAVVAVYRQLSILILPIPDRLLAKKFV